MKKFMSLFLIFSLLALSGTLFAKERQGSKLIVQKKDGEQVKGELIAVKNKSLLLMDSESGADVSIEIGKIKVITIVKKSWLLLGTGIGLLAGGTIVAINRNKWEKTQSIGDYFTSLIGVPVITTLLGAGIGGGVGVDEKIQIEGSLDLEIYRILEELRKKARFPKY